MKIDRHGQAKILTSEDITRLFTDGLLGHRDRCLFGICLYTGCRISEALSLSWSDVGDSMLTIRKGNTKGKIATRQIDIHPRLAALIATYRAECTGDRLFPGRYGRGQLTRVAADGVLRQACDRCGIVGVSTHSFRRTALTRMSNAGVPLRVIQQISGHKTLSELQKYLEVMPEQVTGAIAALRW